MIAPITHVNLLLPWSIGYMMMLHHQFFTSAAIIMVSEYVSLCLISFYFSGITAIRTENGNAERLLDDFDIKLHEVFVEKKSFIVKFTSSKEVSIFWFVDRDIPVISGDKTFMVFNTVLKPTYITKLAIVEDYDVIVTLDIRLLLVADDKSVEVRLNTSNIHSVQSQPFSMMKFENDLVDQGDKVSVGVPLFDIRSSLEADVLEFQTLKYQIDSWGGGVLYIHDTNPIRRVGSMIVRSFERKSDNMVYIMLLKVGYSSGLVGSLVISEEINLSKGGTVLPDGNFSFRRGNIYYRKIDSDLYRCSAVGKMNLEIQIDNDGTMINGTTFPHVYVRNGHRHDLFVIRRPGESCTPALFCQAFYSYKGLPISSTSYQLPPRYKPWYPFLEKN